MESSWRRYKEIETDVKRLVIGIDTEGAYPVSIYVRLWNVALRRGGVQVDRSRACDVTHVEILILDSGPSGLVASIVWID